MCLDLTLLVMKIFILLNVQKIQGKYAKFCSIWSKQWWKSKLFASEVLCHNPLLPGLPDHALPVLNHNQTDHNTKPMENWRIATVAFSVTTVWCNHFTGELVIELEQACKPSPAILGNGQKPAATAKGG